MPRKKPNKVRERTAIICASNFRRTRGRTRRLEPAETRIPGLGFVQGSNYGMMVCGGTDEIVFLHTTESIRHGPTLAGRPGSAILVEPVVTLAGTCEGSPFARVSSAAREQFPLVMVHQFCVIG